MLLLHVVLKEFAQHPTAAGHQASTCSMAYEDLNRLMIKNLVLDINKESLGAHEQEMRSIVLEAAQ